MAGRGTQQLCATGLPHLGAATNAQQPLSGGKAHRDFPWLKLKRTAEPPVKGEERYRRFF